jgi:hypothetical protein
MRLVLESGRKPPAVLPRPTASGHVNSVGQGDRLKRSGLKLGSCYFQNAREPDHDIISIATQAGAFVLFIHWRAEPSGAPHPARALGRAGDFFLHLARLSFLIHDRRGGTHRRQKRGDRRASPGHHRSAGSPSSQAAFYLAARDRQANHSDARGWLRDALVGGAVPGLK